MTLLQVAMELLVNEIKYASYTIDLPEIYNWYLLVV